MPMPMTNDAQNEMYWKGTGTGAHILPIAVSFYRFHSHSRLLTACRCLSENRFLFIQWKLIASINDCCVWLKWCGPRIKSMWLNWEYGRARNGALLFSYINHDKCYISLAWTAFVWRCWIKSLECVLIELLRSIDLFSFLMIKNSKITSSHRLSPEFQMCVEQTSEPSACIWSPYIMVMYETVHKA